MVLQPQNIQFLFQGGLNSIVDQFQVSSPQLLKADNVRFTRDGALDKRTGFINLPKNVIGGGQLSAGVAIKTFEEELLAFDGTFIYSYVQSLNSWINKGVAVSVINNQRKILSTRIAQQSQVDGTNLDGLELYVWRDDRFNQVNTQSGIRYSIIDSNTGSFIVDDKFIYPLGFNCKVLAVSNSHQFNVYYQASNKELFLNTIGTNKPSTLLPFNLSIIDGLGTSTGFAYDVCLNNGKPVVVYSSSSGLTILLNGVFTTVINNIIPNCIATITGASANDWWIVYSISTGTFALNVNTNVLTKIDNLPSVNIAIIEDIISHNLNITYEIDPGNGNPHYIKNAILQNNNKVIYNNIQRKLGLASKPFKVNNQIFVNTVYNSTNQATYFTLCVSQNMKAISKINAQVGGTYLTNGLLPQCDVFTTIPGQTIPAPNNQVVPPAVQQVMFVNQKKGLFLTNNNTSFSLLGVNASYLQFNNNNAFNSLEAASNLHIVGGIEKVYDGTSVVEDNFHLFAETSTGFGAIATLVSGGGLQTGQYQYVIVYEWADNFNQIERGQPSIPITITATAGQGVQLVIPTLTVTDKTGTRSPISIAIFRTIIQLGSPSSIFYKVTSDLSPVVNDVTVDTVTFIDNTTDVQIAANEPLYTTSQLPNSAPPSCSLISNYATRVMISGLEDPNVIWISQDRFELDNYNTIPIEFSQFLIQGVSSTGGAITAIRVLDESLIIFKANSIYFISGEGPNANGTSGQFTNAVPVPSNAGCINPNSIVEIPGNNFNSGGLIFQSQNGLYLFDRGHIVSYIGKDVQQYNYLHITSAQLLDTKNEVVFCSLEGIILVYNYLFNRWSTWSTINSVGSCLWNNQLTLIQQDGTVLVQKDDYYADYSTANVTTFTRPIIRTIQLPWLAFGGIQGYQSAFWATLLGHYISPHLLNISCSYNYDPKLQNAVSINSNMVSNLWGSLPNWGSPPNFGGGPFTPYEFQYYFTNPWCTSVSLTISDVPLTNNDQGVVFSAITFQVGVFKDTVRLPKQQKVSGNK